jgi:hypothetical protein
LVQYVASKGLIVDEAPVAAETTTTSEEEQLQKLKLQLKK